LPSGIEANGVLGRMSIPDKEEVTVTRNRSALLPSCGLTILLLLTVAFMVWIYVK
jgi:hypothetical protein